MNDAGNRQRQSVKKRNKKSYADFVKVQKQEKGKKKKKKKKKAGEREREEEVAEEE